MAVKALALEGGVMSERAWGVERSKARTGEFKSSGCDGLRSLGPFKEPDVAEWWGGNWVSKRLSQRGNWVSKRLSQCGNSSGI